MSGARRARGPRAAIGLALLAVLAAAPRRAEAYVRYKTESGIGFFWPQSWIPVTVYPDSMKDVNGGMDMTPDQIVHAVTAAANAWSAAENACTYLQINVTPSTEATPTARYDGRNSLVFRTGTWCAPSDGPTTCSYDPAALAITSVFHNKKEGKIRDADIEVNAKNFVWADLDFEPKLQGKQDLQNALAHEMGHLIGLDHSCYSGDPPPPLDNTGSPAPDCNTAVAAVRETTMFASAMPGDVEKRTPAADDILAVCEIYPLADDPMIYKTGPDDPGGCTCALGDAGRGAGAAPLVSLLGIAAALGRRRRGRGR